jgi:hypothetical protein
MPQNAWSPKRERQYEHIKTEEKKRGRPEGTAERIAAATVNRTRTAKGETKEPMPQSKRRSAQQAAKRTSSRNAAKNRGRSRSRAS